MSSKKKRYDQIVISSTYIRDVLSQGNVTLAAELLGYRYGVTGIVRHGRQRGADAFGFPTIECTSLKKKKYCQDSECMSAVSI